MRQGSSEETKEIERLVDKWVKILETQDMRADLVLSAAMRLSAYLILNEFKGDPEEAMDSFKNIGAPIIEEYIKRADEWVRPMDFILN